MQCQYKTRSNRVQDVIVFYILACPQSSLVTVRHQDLIVEAEPKLSSEVLPRRHSVSEYVFIMHSICIRPFTLLDSWSFNPRDLSLTSSTDNSFGQLVCGLCLMTPSTPLLKCTATSTSHTSSATPTTSRMLSSRLISNPRLNPIGS